MGYMEYIQNQTTGIKNLLLEEFYSIPIIQLEKEEQRNIAEQYVESFIQAKQNIEENYHNLNNSREVIQRTIFK